MPESKKLDEVWYMCILLPDQVVYSEQASSLNLANQVQKDSEGDMEVSEKPEQARSPQLQPYMTLAAGNNGYMFNLGLLD